jgi:DNA polymerase-2
MAEHTGWLLDVYAGPQKGLVLWLLCQDENGQPYRLRLWQDFPVSFYAAGPPIHLRRLWRYLEAQPVQIKLSRQEHCDLFQPQPVPVLAVEVAQPAAQPKLFWRISEAFPDLTYYDADLHVAVRHAAQYGTFPLARCRVEANEAGQIQHITTLDTPWENDPLPPPLSVLIMQPEVDPFHAEPRCLQLRCGRASYSLALQPERPLLVNLAAILHRHDPDLLLSMWGDTWLLPRLLELSQKLHIPLPLNRDPEKEVSYRPERTYFTYGQVVYRGRQVLLFGRWHIDAHNAMLFHDYDVDGALEMARVSSLPVQMAARLSPGTGISTMQIQTALRLGIMVPWHKQQAERPKTALELFSSDQGGLVYQPTTGLHSHVGEVDFISMYPSIMAHFNISPETVGSERPTAELVPELGMIVDRQQPGLVPQTLQPLLDKRLALKSRLAVLPPWDPRRGRYQACASAHKWLLVTCFGYLGYKNARFGRIEAHEAVTAYGREALLRAKEAAEDLGFSVLHMYVDGLWVQKPDAKRPPDFQTLLDEIVTRTGLPVALDGVYRWVAFLPSRVNPSVPVPNRYFGVFQDSSLKMRGIETRRRDSPLFVAETQQSILDLLAQAPQAEALPDCLPEVLRLLRRQVAKLRKGRIPPVQLVVGQKLSKTLDEYRDPSPAARAAVQLAAVGKTIKQGQRVRFVYTLGKPGVHAWDLPNPPDPRSVDVRRYITLLLRAASNVLQPLDVAETTLHDWVLGRVSYFAPPGVVPKEKALPLMVERKWLVLAPVNA